MMDTYFVIQIEWITDYVIISAATLLTGINMIHYYIKK